jgi:TatD DNase family protein
MELFDTHSHLDDEQFESTREQVIERARQAGVRHLIAVGTTLHSSRRSVLLSREHDFVHAAVGIHPNHCHEVDEEDWQEILELAAEPEVVAIGETGLDRYWDFAPFDLQLDYFERHIDLACKHGLPFIVHMRDCGGDVVNLMQRMAAGRKLRGVMHSFAGDWLLAEQCLELGLHISFAGMLTYKKSENLRSVAKQVPADRLLLETDSPYLSPEPKRNVRPNEPALIRYTAECLAEARGMKPADLALICTQNAKALFLSGRQK